MSVNFLDITITKSETRLNTKVYLKPTDRNSYLCIRSGHYPAWIRNIPKGQILRVRHNCTELDYFAQAGTLKDKFIQKGYREDVLDITIIEIAKIPRKQCLRNKDAKPLNDQHQWGFISNFHYQYREIENLFSKYWHILCRNRHLCDTLPNKPQFIYRRAPNFGDQVVRKILDPPDPQALKIDLKGFFSCRKCICCRTVTMTMTGMTSVTNIDQETFEIDTFITCNSSYVVYLLWCPCGLYYVGRTKRLLKVRIAEHLANIRNGLQISQCFPAL